jgi:proprotein convertase subtilisin/kexin type 5
LIPDTAESAKIGDVPVGSAKVFECADECATCSGSPGNCETCEEFREGVACTCIKGYFEETVNGVKVCSPCSFRCLACTSYDFCTECSGDRVGLEKCGCYATTWDNGVDVDCQPCDYNYCKECDTSATHCTVCADGRDPIDACPCIDGTYDNLEDDVGTCYDCSYPCATCSETADYCTSCNDEEHRIYDD